jgi:hypothetical protein
VFPISRSPLSSHQHQHNNFCTTGRAFPEANHSRWPRLKHLLSPSDRLSLSFPRPWPFNFCPSFRCGVRRSSRWLRRLSPSQHSIPPKMDASVDGTESVDQFLARIASLSAKQGPDDAERSKRAEEELLQARKERQARRAGTDQPIHVLGANWITDTVQNAPDLCLPPRPALRPH